MKIEMGESLFYSWLRHIKVCQMVQTNWTTSNKWPLCHEDKLEEIKQLTDNFFSTKYDYSIYKNNASLSQLLQQAECDVIGISIQNGSNKVYAVDVAFHENGLNYGGKESTVQKIIRKMLRTAMCIYGYLDTREAEIIFASPKIHQNVLDDVLPCLTDMQKLMDDLCFHFRFRIIANENFREEVLNPVLLVSKDVADTNELFLRSYQMMEMFEYRTDTSPSELLENSTAEQEETEWKDGDVKVGKIAQTMLRKMLEEGAASEKEVEQMQTAEYSKAVFDLNYPLLAKADSDYSRVRYYTKPLVIRGTMYMLCSQWFETETNNDRPYLEKWMEQHQPKASTKAGYINRNGQRNIGVTGKPGTDRNQLLYEMECLKCGKHYYANGSNISQKKCPACQGGKQ